MPSGNRITNTGPPHPNGRPPDLGAQRHRAGGLLRADSHDGRRRPLPWGDAERRRLRGDPFPDKAGRLGRATPALSEPTGDFTPDIALRWNFSDAGSLFARYVEGLQGRRLQPRLVLVHRVHQGRLRPGTGPLGGAGRPLQLPGRPAALELGGPTAPSTRISKSPPGLSIPSAGPATNIFINAAESTIQGLETDLTFAAENGFFAKWSLALNDTKYDSFANAECLHSERLAGDCDPNGRTIDLSGHRV